nr:hypothetical protein [Pseudomonas sp. BIGb0427]
MADPLIEQRIYPGRKQPRVAIRKLAPEQRPSLALLQPAKRAALGLVVEQEGSRQVVLHDTKGELLNVYTFTRGQCWVLQRIDDWSLAGFFTGRQEKVAGELDVERARLYENLGRAGLYDNPGQLMNAALNSLLSAATKGNNEAAVQAVILIFSGMPNDCRTRPSCSSWRRRWSLNGTPGPCWRTSFATAKSMPRTGSARTRAKRFKPCANRRSWSRRGGWWSLALPTRQASLASRTMTAPWRATSKRHWRPAVTATAPWTVLSA